MRINAFKPLVQDQSVNLLDSGCIGARHHNLVVAYTQSFTAALARKEKCNHALFLCSGKGRNHVGAVATSRKANQDVPAASESLNPREKTCS